MRFSIELDIGRVVNLVSSNLACDGCISLYIHVPEDSSSRDNKNIGHEDQTNRDYESVYERVLNERL